MTTFTLAIAKIIDPRLAEESWRQNFAYYVPEVEALAITKAEAILALAKGDRADARLDIMAALYKAWPHAEDMDGTDQGVVGLIEQLTAERDAARQALAEIVQGRPGWREAARRASEAMGS